MPSRDLSAILGFPNLAPAPSPPPLLPSLKLQPSPRDRNQARELLIHVRTSNPSYKPPAESKRRHFRSEHKNKVLADTAQWIFSPYEVATGVAYYFSHETLPPGVVLAALLEHTRGWDGHDVDSIWERSQTPPRKWYHWRKPKPLVGACPWISIAADRSASDALSCLLEAGGSQKDLGTALEAALVRKDYVVARELAAYDAPFPHRPDLFSAATSRPLDMDFVNLWLAALSLPDAEFAKPAIVTTMSMSSAESRKALSMLLTSYPPSTAEAATLLLRAIEIGNLETLATISAALHHCWPALGDTHHSEPCARTAIGIQHADTRQRVLSFLFAAGVEPNLPALRFLLLREVEAENVGHIRLLVSHGVPPHVRDGHPPLSPLEAAVKTSHVDILRLLVVPGALIPSDVASVAVEQISDRWSEQTQADMLDLLAPHVNEPKDSLSKLLLRAVQRSNRTVIHNLLRHGARSSYVDDGGANSLLIAVGRGDVALIQKLCTATPTASVASRALVPAYEAFGSAPESMLTVTSLLVLEAATGDAAELSRMLTTSLGMRGTVRTKVCEIILAASPYDIGQSEALVRVVGEPDLDMGLVDLLLRKAASVDHDDGRALVTAVERGSVQLLKALLGVAVTPLTKSRAFRAAMAFPAGSPRTELTALLLSAGVSLDDRTGHLLTAVKSRDLALLESLLAVHGTVRPLAEDALAYAVKHAYVQDVAAMIRRGTPEPMLVKAFQALIHTNNLHSPQFIETGALLMSLKVPDSILTSTLLTVCSEGAAALPVEFITLLIKHGADPMAKNAQCIVTAAKKYDNVCAERLMAAQSFRLDAAVRALISSINDEKWAAHWVSLCLKWSAARFREHSLLRLALKRFPSGVTLLRQLLDNGCDPMLKCSCKNDKGHDTTLLMWALGKDGRASDEVVLAILDHPLAGSQFIHPADGLTAMHLAAGSGRLLVLNKLTTLQGDFHIQLPDSAGRTPLCCATEAGNAGVMTALVDAGAKVDDGSLHIAARNLDIASIKLLRANGHDVYYPHAILGGRRPLAELCFTASGSGPSWEFQLEATIRELLPLPDPQWRLVHDKSFLHLAIDNKTSAHALLGAILRVSQLWRNPNRDDEYLYADLSTGLFRSLTKYVEHLCPGKSAREKESLVSLLKAQQFVDRFYAETGPQPPGAIGMPKEVADAVREEKQAQWKQQLEFRRQEEAAAQQNRLTDELNRRNANHMEALHEQQLRQAREQGQQQLDNAIKAQEEQRKHQAALGDVALEAQKKLADVTEKAELSRMEKTMRLQEEHQDRQHRKAIQQATAEANERIRVAGETERIALQAHERRLEIEAKHHTGMGRMQVNLLEEQARVIADVRAKPVQGGLPAIEWKGGGVDAISLS